MNIKRYNLIPCFLVIALLATVVFSGCSDNKAVRMRYEAEKKLHHAEKGLKKAYIKPELVSPAEMDKIRQQFIETSDYCMAALDSVNSSQSPVEYHELQQLAFSSANQLAQLFYRDKQYNRAIKFLTNLLNNTTLQNKHIIISKINLGSAYQASGNWDSALAVYNSTLEQFYPPVDDQGEVLLTLFNLPLRILRIVSLTGDSTATMEQFDKAMAYYRGLVTKYPDSKVAVASRGNLARLYDEAGDWEKEITELTQIEDSTSNTYFPVRIKIADLYGKKLKQFNRALEIYNDVLSRLQGQDTLLIPQVQQKIAMVNMEQGKYSEARRKLADIKKNYPQFFATQPMAQLAVCRSFELGGNWKRAEIEYNVLIEKYRGSDEAMSSYLYVADHLKEVGREAEAKRWYANAEEYYKQLAATGAGTLLEAKAFTYQADLYRQLGDWSKAVKMLEKVYNRFPSTSPGQRSLLKASAIYRKYLDDPHTADSLIEVFKASIADFSGDKES